ncbi:MAG: hypothetical protein VX932_04350, partial [Candidatus Neomarinimicrobiota bacterium]|nr:hypothetical protein [Candidatus Neomarinimicrobiota bacterium]
MKKAFSGTSIIAESIFILCKGKLIKPKEISNDGVWCTLIDESNGKSVIRVLVQLKDKTAHNFAVNINHELNKTRFKQETNWLV